ncbi:MAG: type II secretion system protein GspM, partial [Chromatocurvus sp.]
MKQWFARFTGREQISLIALAAALLLFLLYHLLWSPLTAARDDMLRRNAVTADSLQRVGEMASRIAGQRGAGAAQPSGRSVTA